MRTPERQRKIKAFLSEHPRLLAGVVLFMLFAVLFLVLDLSGKRLADTLPDQAEAGRWDEDGGSAQISCFFLQDAVVTKENIREFEYNIAQALSEASLTRNLARPGSRLFADCYSAAGTVTMKRETRSLTCRSCGTGGDFFLFHPVGMLSGGYFSGTSLMQDQVILNEEAAFRLFGSNDIVGQKVEIGGVLHTVAGVCADNDGRLSRAAGNDGSFVYLSFDSLSAYGTMTGAGLFGGTSSVSRYGTQSLGGASFKDSGWAAGMSGTGPSAGISCFEVVMPDIVRHFARNIVTEKMGASADSMIVVDNTHRFDWEEIMTVVFAFGTRSMQTKAVNFPYWENEARGMEDILALLFVFKVLCIAGLILLAGAAAVQAYRHKKWTAAGVMRDLSDRIYDCRAKAAARKTQARRERNRTRRMQREKRRKAEALRRRAAFELRTGAARAEENSFEIIEWM